MYTLENDTLLVQLQAKGAELTRIQHKQNGIDYLWDAQPQVWAKHAPVLFPIVGSLKESRFVFKGVSYELPRHGFARDRVFTCSNEAPGTISLSLHSDAETQKVFPFAFVFTIHYTLHGNSLEVAYEVSNPDAGETLYFSVGGHPAFRLPLEPALQYEDYYLAFDKEETTGRWPIVTGGLIDTTPQPLLQASQRLPLTKQLFEKDALVLKQLHSDAVELRTDKSPHGLRFSFPGFPFLGLWAAPGADFLCIEPWCGIADSSNHNQLLEEKEGIIALPAGEAWKAAYTIRFF